MAFIRGVDIAALQITSLGTQVGSWLGAVGTLPKIGDIVVAKNGSVIKVTSAPNVNTYGYAILQPVEANLAFKVTTTAAAETFKLFLSQTTVAEPDFLVDWGDGNSDQITSKTSLDLEHPYAIANTYTIVITGIVPGLAFVDDLQGIHSAKITEIISLGVQGFETLRGAFFGLINAISTATSLVDTSGVTNFSNMFHLFGGNIDVSEFNTSSVTTIRGMFFGAANCNPDCSAWDIGNLTNASIAFNGSGLSTTNLDALLIAWQAQPHQSGVTLDAIDTARTSASDAAVTALEGDSWVINTM